MLVGFSALSMFSKNALLQLCSSVTLTDLVTDLVLDFSHDIQIRQTWFHHQHISSFFHISLLQHRTTVKISYSSCNKPPITQTYTQTQISSPQLEWRVLWLREAADNSACPQTQVWTVQHLCTHRHTRRGASVYSHFKTAVSLICEQVIDALTYLKGP